MASKKKTAKTSRKTPTKEKKAMGGRPPEGSVPSKSDYIRANPDLSVKDLLTKAKETGMSLSSVLVYKVRHRATAKTPKTGPSKRGPRPKDGKMSASAFVRTLPADMKAKDAIAAGAQAGYKVTAGLFYMVRSLDKKKAGGGPAPVKAKKGKPGRPKGSKTKTKYQDWKPTALIHGTGGGDELAFKKMALEIGFPRALRVIEDLSKRAEAVQRQYQALLG